jgi:hypothetical protein
MNMPMPLGHVLLSRRIGAVYEYQLCMPVPFGACSAFTVWLELLMNTSSVWQCRVKRVLFARWVKAAHDSAMSYMLSVHSGKDLFMNTSSVLQRNVGLVLCVCVHVVSLC